MQQVTTTRAKNMPPKKGNKGGGNGPRLLGATVIAFHSN
jgi:hypothetical protein